MAAPAPAAPAGSAAGGSADKPADKPADKAPDAAPEVVGKDRFREQVSDTLKELLKDPEFAKQFQKSGGPKFGYKKDVDYQGSGFFIEDDLFRLNLESRLQVRYTYYNQLDKNHKNEVFDNTATNRDVRSDFGIPRLRLAFNGFAYSKDITYLLEIDASSNNRAGGDGGAGGIGDIADLNLAFVNWNVLGSNTDVPDFWRDSFQIRAGQFQMPFGRSGVLQTWARQAELDTHLVDRMIADQLFRADRNVGVELHGSLGGPRDGLPADRPGTRGFFEYDLAISNGFQSKGQRYGIDAGGVGTAGRGLDKYPALIARGNFDVLKGRFEGEDGKDYYWFGRNVSDLENHITPAWQVGSSFGWQRIRDQNSPADSGVLGDFYHPTQLVERVPVFNSKGQITGYTDGSTLPVDLPGSDVIRLGADTAFKWHGFAIQTEFYYQWLNGLNNVNNRGILQPNQDQDNLGFYTTVGYFIIPKKWELVGGISGVFAPHRPIVGQGTRAAGTDGSPVHDAWQFSFGTNYFPFSTQKLRLSLDCSYLQNTPLNAPTQGYQQSGGENAWQVRAQVTFGF